MEKETPTMASFTLKIKSKFLKVAYKDLCDLAIVHLLNKGMLSLTPVVRTFSPLP